MSSQIGSNLVEVYDFHKVRTTVDTYLAGLKYDRYCIKDLQKRHQELQLSSISALQYDEYNKTKGTANSQVERVAIKLNQLEEELDRAIFEYNYEMRRVKKFVKTTDAMQILWLVEMSHWSIEKAGKKFGYKRRQTYKKKELGYKQFYRQLIAHDLLKKS